MNREKVKKYNTEELREAIRRREEELVRLQNGEFNRVHREQFLKVSANINRLKKLLNRRHDAI